MDDRSVKEKLTPPRMVLNTPQNCRKTMARLVRYRSTGKIDDSTYRALVWGLSQLLGYWKHETDQELLQRIEAIEERIQNEV